MANTDSEKYVTQKQRLDYKEASPGVMEAMIGLEKQVHKSGLEPHLLEFIKARASQINGCAWCLDMHTKDARARGETEQRLYLLGSWREAHCYTAQERALLAWTEAVTVLGGAHGVSDEVYNEAREFFNEKQLVDITLAIIAINGWNRLNVAFRTNIGDYVSPHKKS